MAPKKTEVAKLMRFLPLDSLIGQVVDLKRNGSEFKGLCPFHKENTPSFTVFTGIDGKERYACHACGQKGDHVQFLMEYHGLDFKEAVKMLEELTGGADLEVNNDVAQRKIERAIPSVPDWEACPAPEDLPAPKSIQINRDGQWVSSPVLASWAYRGLDGELLGYTCRVEPVPGKKEIIPVTHKANTKTGEMKLKNGSLPIPRSLYGAELVMTNPKAPIVLAEGEKATEAGRRLLGEFGVIVLSWAGGCKAVDKADWSILRGRKLVGWPDCDSQRYGDNHPMAGEFKPYHEQPGMAAMIKIAGIAKQYGCEMRIVGVPQPGGEWANGLDFADLEEQGWTPAKTMAYLKENLRMPEDIAPVEDDEAHEQPYADLTPPPMEEIPLDAYSYDQHGQEDMGVSRIPDSLPPVAASGYIGPDPDRPYRVLGWDNSTGYYLSRAVSQVVAIPVYKHNKQHLIDLAPLEYWRRAHGLEKKTGDGINWDEVLEVMVMEAQRMGIYDPGMIRGRGAWWDRGKWAVHLGSRVVMGDGENAPVSYALSEIDSKYVYPQAKPLTLSFDNPLQSQQSRILAEICAMPRWTDPLFGNLLAGFIFLAPICGALNWRPHLWVTGAQGTGKSFIMTEIVTRVLEGVAIAVQGDTSEAGIRQTLEHDAVPIIWDEFESETKKAEQRTEDVLAMVTRASSESQAGMVKGGADGKATSYKTRSMFIFGSISVGIKQNAAKSRITKLSLMAKSETAESQANFKAMEARIENELTPEFSSGLQARAIRMIPVIRQNAKTFAEAAGIVLGNRRAGDQIGTLLAGVYGLHSSGLITEERALEYVKAKHSEPAPSEIIEADERRCLTAILSYPVRVEISIGSKTRTIGELVRKSNEQGNDLEITKHEADTTLARMGLVVFQKLIQGQPHGPRTLRVAYTHAEIQKILDKTPWSVSYHLILERVPGSKLLTARDFAGSGMRCVEIPVSEVFPDTATD